jgi:hypothetical protein
MLKSFVQSIPALYEGLGGTQSVLLAMIRENCRAENIDPTIQLIREVINEDVTYQKTPLDLRNQRTYAVKVMQFYFPITLSQTDIFSLVLVAFSMLLDRLSKKPPKMFIGMLLKSIVC